MKKRVLSSILIFSILISMSGCTFTKFDAAGYVKACLDAAYHNDYKVYAEFIDSTEEDVKAAMEEQNQLAVENEFSNLEINVTDTQKKEYLALLKEIENLTKYEVGQVKETEDGFSVSVTIYPLDVYEQFLNGINEVYQKAADKGELSDDTIFQIMIEYLKECVSNVQYKKKVDIIIQVTQDNNSIWQISEEEMIKLDDLLLPGI